MSTNVNIQLDSNLLNSLISVAESKGITLSEEIELRLLMAPASVQKKPHGGVSSKLRGIVKLPKDFDYKKELEAREA